MITKEKEFLVFETIHERKDKSRYNVEVKLQKMSIDNKEQIVVLASDITNIIQKKKQIQLLSQAVKQTDELIRITDKNGTITFVNDAFIVHTGYKQIDLIGKRNNIFKSEKHDQEFYKSVWDTILSGKTFRGIFINKNKDNNIIQHFVSTGVDITERIKTEEKLHKLATIDTLTEIYNRHKISEELGVEIARAQRYDTSFTLIMIDIDYFKKINDIHGHDIGDYGLKEFASVILNNIRESDRFGRWGGEEFIIISPDTDKISDENFTEKLRRAIEMHTFKYVNHMTISIGTTIYEKDDTKEKLLKRVDDALYKAKESGRNIVKFN